MSGKNKYLPKIVIEELGEIKINSGINKDCKAMQKMVEYSQIGRNVEKIMAFPFKKKKKGRGLFDEF